LLYPLARTQTPETEPETGVQKPKPMLKTSQRYTWDGTAWTEWSGDSLYNGDGWGYAGAFGW